MFSFSTCMFSSYTFKSQFQLEFILVFSVIHLILSFFKYDYHIVSNYYFKVCFSTDLRCFLYDISPHAVGLFLDFLFFLVSSFDSTILFFVGVLCVLVIWYG